LFKHILWLWTVRERDQAIRWINANFTIEDDEAPFASTQYTFWTTHDLTDEQKKIIRTTLNPRDFISE
jgi:hypothetical protein